jgi:hypothetical protein
MGQGLEIGHTPQFAAILDVNNVIDIGSYCLALGILAFAKGIKEELAPASHLPSLRVVDRAACSLDCSVIRCGMCDAPTTEAGELGAAWL